jgi:hypothetical protein
VTILPVQSGHTDRATAPMPSGCSIVVWLIAASIKADIPQLLLRLIGSADDRALMWSNAPRSVGAVGAGNRTVVTITVMVRVSLVDSYSPIGADASGSIDAIDTGGCVARLSEHERAKCSHDGEHRRAISGDA